MSRMVGARSMFNTGAYEIDGFKLTQIEPMERQYKIVNTIKAAGPSLFVWVRCPDPAP